MFEQFQDVDFGLRSEVCRDQRDGRTQHGSLTSLTSFLSRIHFAGYLFLSPLAVFFFFIKKKVPRHRFVENWLNADPGSGGRRPPKFFIHFGSGSIFFGPGWHPPGSEWVGTPALDKGVPWGIDDRLGGVGGGSRSLLQKVEGGVGVHITPYHLNQK